MKILFASADNHGDYALVDSLGRRVIGGHLRVARRRDSSRRGSDVSSTRLLPVDAPATLARASERLQKESLDDAARPLNVSDRQRQPSLTRNDHTQVHPSPLNVNRECNFGKRRLGLTCCKYNGSRLCLLCLSSLAPRLALVALLFPLCRPVLDLTFDPITFPVYAAHCHYSLCFDVYAHRITSLSAKEEGIEQSALLQSALTIELNN